MPDPSGLLPMEARNPYASASLLQGRAEVKPDEYMIVDGPRVDGKIRFNSDGFISFINPGKIVTTASHNLDALRAQGIQLKPMPKWVPEDEDEGEETEGGDAVA
jgi:hypothetical protein